MQRLQEGASQRAHHSAPMEHANADPGLSSFKVGTACIYMWCLKSVRVWRRVARFAKLECMQGDYLAQMEKDAVNLEMCTKEIRSQIISNDFSRSMQQRISRGQDNAVRCTHWYALQILSFL